MKDCKFKQLILDVYKEWKNPERTFIKKEMGIECKYNNFWGTLYGAIARDSFMDITDIKRYLDISTVDMFLLNSRVTRQEIEIYEWQLENYKIENNKLMLELKNKEVIFEI